MHSLLRGEHGESGLHKPEEIPYSFSPTVVPVAAALIPFLETLTMLCVP